MGAKVIIYGQSLNSHFLKDLTHCALFNLIVNPLLLNYREHHQPPHIDDDAGNHHD